MTAPKRGEGNGTGGNRLRERRPNWRRCHQRELRPETTDQREVVTGLERGDQRLRARERRELTGGYGTGGHETGDDGTEERQLEVMRSKRGKRMKREVS
ncbi:hypothetical protein ACJRO7_011725 [Eucalyptus globulus]|uniref:Uncharacterized protein n=1 Tax=Eucalyptus globulus TaxID=34317 RepID=A0ABD3LG69_EUCGL